MEITMPYVQVKQKYQVTIPATLRNQLDIHEGDTLEASIDNGVSGDVFPNKSGEYNLWQKNGGLSHH